MTFWTAAGGVLRLEFWVLDKKNRGDMGERNTENLKQGKGNECSDTRVGERKIGVRIVQCSQTL
jgi:hypothetical protein